MVAVFDELREDAPPHSEDLTRYLAHTVGRNQRTGLQAVNGNGVHERMVRIPPKYSPNFETFMETSMMQHLTMN